MNRRELLALFGAAAAVSPSGGTAQQAKIPTVGVLLIESSSAQRFGRSFPEALRQLGYLEGQNIHLD
jgi:putative tryptophan/tyrosine transport system substrate-binding protein